MIGASSCFLPLSVCTNTRTKKNGQNLPESDTLITQEEARKRLQQNNVDETDHA